MHTIKAGEFVDLKQFDGQTEVSFNVIEDGNYEILFRLQLDEVKAPPCLIIHCRQTPAVFIHYRRSVKNRQFCKADPKLSLPRVFALVFDPNTREYTCPDKEIMKIDNPQ